MWRFVGTCYDGEPFEINGINVWAGQWEPVLDEEAEVRDPLYNQAFRFSVYRVERAQDSVEFAAGEFSNGVWGFYTRSAQDSRTMQ